MAYDERLAERIRHAFGERRDITERTMFGGLAFLLHGRMCCGIVGTDLMVRVPDDEFDAVIRGPYVRPMDFTGRPLRGFLYVSPRGFRTATALRTWLGRGERVAQQQAVGTKTRMRRGTRPASTQLGTDAGPHSQERGTRRARVSRRDSQMADHYVVTRPRSSDGAGGVPARLQ